MLRRALVVLVLAGCSAREETHAHDAAVHDDSGHDAGADVAHDTHREETADSELPPPPKVPETLAETGLYADFAAGTLAEGVVAFDVRYPLWSDGAEKKRYLWLPAGTKIDTTNPDHWTYPKGAKSWKEFHVAGKRIETRFLEKTGEGDWGWRYVAYAWSEDQKSAVAARAGKKDALGTKHDIPSQEQCDQCHSGTRDGLIGPGAFQWSGQYAKLGSLFATAPADVEPPGTGAVKDALGYLHGNCGYCHSDFGRWAGARKMRTKLRVGDTDEVNTATYRTLINVEMSHADGEGNLYVGIVPGNPDKSHVVMRMARRDGIWDMPPAGTEVVDTAALARIREWITALK